MPKLDLSQDMETFKIPNSFSFSGQKIDKSLGGTNFTITSIVVDESGSVLSFKSLLESSLKNSILALRKSPRADNMLVRTTAFNHSLRELHGFKKLNSINPDDYDNCLFPYGGTALHAAALEGVSTMLTYGQTMTAQHYDVNGVVYVITDGDNNDTTTKASEVKAALVQAIQGEQLESLISVLIGVNIQDNYMKSKLDKFHLESGFSKFIAMEDASPKSLAKMTDFVVSQSISQSQALGSGGPSKVLSF